MALDEAYNVAGDLWIGPDSAKDTVDPNSGRVYEAVDTQLEYYGDGEEWVTMGTGSEQAPVPEGHYESVYTDEQSITGELDRTPGSSGGYIFLAGAATHFPNGDRPQDNLVMCYDIKRDEWQYLSRMNYGRHGSVIVEYNGYIWVFGGDRVGDTVERYDIENDEWEEMPSLDTARPTRLSSNGVVIDGNVYICGGGTDGDNRFTTVEKYDLDNHTVEYVSDMPVTHSFPMQAKYNGYLWLITGNSDEDYGGHVQRYDPATDTWDGPGNFEEHPHNVTDGAGTQIGNEFHFIGGWSTTGNNRFPAGHYVYEMDNDNWRLERELDGEYSHGKIAFDGTYLHRFMGRTQYGKQSFTNSVWRYHMERGQESTATSCPEIAHNMNLIHIDQQPYGR